MKEIYYLNQDTLPAMPVPHDCIINKIMLEEQSLVFSFINDISRYDSVRNLRPNAKSLTIRYHLIDDVYWLYKSFKCGKIFYREGGYKGLPQDALVSKFRFISELDLKSGVADWNISSSATPSALKQQAYERFTIRLYQPSSSWSEQYSQSHSLSNSRSCHASS